MIRECPKCGHRMTFIKFRDETRKRLTCPDCGYRKPTKGVPVPSPVTITDRMIYDAVTKFLPAVCEVYDYLDDTNDGSIPAVDVLAPRIEVALRCAREAVASLPYDDPINPPDPAPSHDDAHDAEPYDGLS